MSNRGAVLYLRFSCQVKEIGGGKLDKNGILLCAESAVDTAGNATKHQTSGQDVTATPSRN